MPVTVPFSTSLARRSPRGLERRAHSAAITSAAGSNSSRSTMRVIYRSDRTGRRNKVTNTPTTATNAPLTTIVSRGPKSEVKSPACA